MNTDQIIKLNNQNAETLKRALEAENTVNKLTDVELRTRLKAQAEVAVILNTVKEYGGILNIIRLAEAGKQAQQASIF